MKQKPDGIIEVGGRQYKLRYVDGLRNHDGDPIWGWYQSVDMEIQIEAGLTKEARASVLWHEIGHAILEHAGYAGHKDNEALADVISYGVQSVKINGKRQLK